MPNYRDATTGQYTTADFATARPAETVSESVPAHHETPDVAELRRLYEAAMCVGANEMAWDEWTTAISEAADALLDAAAERDALAATVERVRALHRPVGIYDECECSDEAKAEGHEDVEDIGLTCNRMYTVCAECCRDDVYQTEDCASYHDHKPDEAHHCPTIRALDEEADA